MLLYTPMFSKTTPSLSSKNACYDARLVTLTKFASCLLDMTKGLQRSLYPPHKETGGAFSLKTKQCHKFTRITRVFATNRDCRKKRACSNEEDWIWGHMFNTHPFYIDVFFISFFWWHVFVSATTKRGKKNKKQKLAITTSQHFANALSQTWGANLYELHAKFLNLIAVACTHEYGAYLHFSIHQGPSNEYDAIIEMCVTVYDKQICKDFNASGACTLAWRAC